MSINAVPVRCPHCGSNTLSYVNPPTGDRFILITYDSKIGSVNLGSGIGVNVFLCKNCGVLTLTTTTNND